MALKLFNQRGWNFYNKLRLSPNYLREEFYKNLESVTFSTLGRGVGKKGGNCNSKTELAQWANLVNKKKLRTTKIIKKNIFFLILDFF